LNKAIRTELYSRLREKIPKPETELNYVDPFELLIAVILSAQATDISVNKATTKLYPIANTPQGILDLGVNKLKTFIKTIGLYNGKAENIIKTCRLLLEQFDGESRCQALAGRLRMSFLILHLVNPRLLWIHTFFELRTVPDSAKVKHHSKLRND